MKIDYKEMITILFDKIEGVRVEKVTAGSKFRLMGLVADVTEVNETLAKDVLEVVSHEAVLDADTEIDYAELAERVLATELTAPKEDLLENTQLVNEALGVLSCTLGKIADQLERHHSNEEYVRLYEQEKKRYLGSKTAKSARKTFDEWKEDQCYGTPSMEDIEDYRLEKVVRIFEKGVLTSRVEHVRRATRYPNELDFDLLPDDNPFNVGTGGAQKTVGGRGHTEGGLGGRTELFCSGEEPEGAVDRRVVRHVDGRREALYDQVASRFCGCADGFRVA